MEKLKKSLRDRPNGTAWLEASARDPNVANRPADTARKAPKLQESELGRITDRADRLTNQ
jgi:hypothetical protein